MASKITLLFLITATVTLLGASYFLLKGESSEEGFQAQPYSVNDLDINLCPGYTTEIQTAKGSTDCCQGDMVDGKCNGSTFCTKSPAYPGVKICVDKWREYYKDKGLKLCPPTMRNYFENIQNKSALRGCSAGPIVVDGSVPKDGTAKQCRIYLSEADNLIKADSCHVEKMRSRIQCPVVNSRSPPPALQRWWWKDNSLLAFFTCNYPFELGMPDLCYDRASVEAYWDKESPNWRTNKDYVNFLNMASCNNLIKRRNEARQEASRLQAEQRKREEAERKQKEAYDNWQKALRDYKSQQENASRLQQQLDEANRRLQKCKK